MELIINKKLRSFFSILQSNILTGILIFLFILIIFPFDVKAQKPPEWPNFHGPERTNKSKEKGIIKSWSAAGPELLMTISGLGEGYSSVIIADGMLFTAGMTNNQSFIYAFDLNGKLIWKKPNGKAWETTMSWASSYTGTRGTPTYDNGIVYHLAELGRLAAFDSKTGRELWNRELMTEFNAGIPEYGYAESVLIDGDMLYCNPAGKKGFIACFNKLNGKLIWVNSEINGLASYNSSVIMEFGGYRQVVSLSSKNVFGVDSKTGKLLWTMNFENSHKLNNTDPIIYKEYVFVSSGYGKGSMMIKLTTSGSEMKPSLVWETNLMDNHHGGVIFHENKLYGTGSNSRGLFCFDFMTGNQHWKSDGKGSLTFADGMLYLLDEKGIMNLVKAVPEKYELTGTFKVPQGGKGMYWAHPVVCDKMLYIRHTDKLFVYNLNVPGETKKRVGL